MARPERPAGRRLVVHGRVQGVGYRLACRRAALALGLAGRVRNLADGSVEVLAEGTPESLARLAAWCEEGPPGARVERVEAFDVAPSGSSGFEVG